VHVAAARGDVAMLEALLEAGSSVATEDSVGNTALMLACERGHSQVVERLLLAGGDVNTGAALFPTLTTVAWKCPNL
jgi:ankyrin repeat protein